MMWRSLSTSIDHPGRPDKSLKDRVIGTSYTSRVGIVPERVLPRPFKQEAVVVVVVHEASRVAHISLPGLLVRRSSIPCGLESLVFS
jgi:hypothetical protein